jgi:hypothetical protein
MDGEYIRKKSQALHAYIKEDFEESAGRSPEARPFTKQLLQRIDELEKEIKSMETLWPWLRESNAKEAPEKREIEGL